MTLHRISRYWDISVLLLAFVVLAATYSLVIPIGESPDEGGHFEFVRYVVRYHGLPIQKPQVVNEVWDGYHPPLYYVLGAAVSFWVNWNEPLRLVRNPDFFGLAPDGKPDKNFLVHTSAEKWPYKGEVLAWRLVRWLSVFFGTMAVLGCWLAAREIVPQSRPFAIGAAGLLAFTPQFLFFSGVLTNDILAATLGAWLIFALVRIVKGGRSFGLFVAAGLLLGLGLITKTNFAVYGLIILPVLGIVLWRERTRETMRRCLSVLAAAGIVAGWWYIRNFLIYGDLSGLTAHRFTMPADWAGPGELSWGYISYCTSGLWETYWARTGLTNLMPPSYVFSALDYFVYVAAIGLIFLLIRGLFSAHMARTTALVALLLTAVLLISWSSVIRFATYESAAACQGRLLYPAAPAFSILLMLGISQLVMWRGLRLTSSTLVVVFFGFAIYVLTNILQPAYATAFDAPRAQPTASDALQICDCDQLTMRVSPNPAVIGERVSFRLRGTQGSTLVSDDWFGGVSCQGEFWGDKTCTATSAGTFVWTHKWKNCAPNNCSITSDQCSKQIEFSILPNPSLRLLFWLRELPRQILGR